MLEWQQHAQQTEAQLAQSQADLEAARAAESSATQVGLPAPLAAQATALSCICLD